MFNTITEKCLSTFVFLVVASGLFLGSASNVSAGKLEQLIEKGYATVAVGSELPYSDVSEDGHAVGAAPDVARAVLKKLGINEIRPLVFGYGEMVPALVSRRVDIVTAGLYITPQRCESVIYSEPDLCGAEAFAVRKGNPLNIRTYEDIRQNRIIIMTTCAGCAEETYALDRGVKPYQIVIMDNPMHGIGMLQREEVDVFALSGLGIAKILKELNDPDIEIVIPIAGIPMSCGAAAFNQDDREFRDAYDEALEELKDSGEFSDIVEPYGFSGLAAIYVKRSDFCTDN